MSNIYSNAAQIRIFIWTEIDGAERDQGVPVSNSRNLLVF